MLSSSTGQLRQRFTENAHRKWFIGLFSITVLSLTFALFLQGPILHPDSASYLYPNPLRPPMYPLLLQINQALFGTNHYHALIFFQLTIGIWAACAFAQTLKKLFALPIWVIAIITIALLIPYGWQKFGNIVLTEALCYPLFLCATRSLLQGLIGKKTRSFFFFLGWTSLLILTRRQFLFLYPVFGVVLVYLFCWDRRSFKVTTIALLSLTFGLSIIATNLLERSYQYSQHGHFSIAPFTGVQLVVAPLYLANDADSELFKTPLEKSVFLTTRQILQDKKISYDTRPNEQAGVFTLSTYTHFYEHYNTICWEALRTALTKHAVVDVYQVDALTLDMATTLIQAHLIDYIALYFANIVFNLGGFYYAFFLGILFLLLIVKLIYNKPAIAPTPLTLTMFLSLLLTFANYSLVALVEPVLKRYSAYTDTIQISLLLVLAVLAIRASV